MAADTTLFERSKAFSFVLHFYIWCGRWRDALSERDKRGYGYRCGVFYPDGARYWQHHDDWPPFFDSMAALGLNVLSIDALFCYETYASCRVFIDTDGATWLGP